MVQCTPDLPGFLVTCTSFPALVRCTRCGKLRYISAKRKITLVVCVDCNGSGTDLEKVVFVMGRNSKKATLHSSIECIYGATG